MRKSTRFYSHLITASLLASAAFASAQGVITGVNVVKSANGVEIAVTGERLAQPNVTRTMRGSVFIASFKGVLKARSGKQSINAFGVTTVQWTQFTVRPQVARVVLKLRPTDAPVVTPIAGGYRIFLGEPQMMVDPLLIPGTRSVVEPVNKSGEPLAPGEITETPLPVRKPILPKPQPKPVVLGGSAQRPMNPFVAEVLPGMQGKLVTLEFDDADVSQILKALAIQAGVNIVTAPEVKGNLTIKLERVTVEHAMNVITAMAGLRYQLVDKTIVIAPPDRMVDILRGINAKDPDIAGVTETRIIPIYSHQGRQLKSAVYRMVQQTMRSGRYEIVLPSEDPADNPLNAAMNAQGAPGSPAPSPAPSAAAGKTDAADEYVMLIGHRSRLDEVEKVVRDIDSQLCSALGIEVPTSTAIVQQMYSTKGTSASALLTALGVKEGKLGTVTVAATPAMSNSPQTVVLTGREHEVNRIMRALNELDSEGQATDEFMVYNVSYSEPRALRDELASQVPGVRVSISPAAVGNPRLFNAKGNSTQVGGTASTPLAQEAQASAGGSDSSNSSQGAVGGSNGFQGGLSQPYKDMESIAQPMRLILRGSKEQLTRAEKMLGILDVAPRMVALEVRVMELSKDDAINVGLDWNIFTGGAVKFIRLQNTVETPSNSIGVNIRDRNFTGDVVGTLDKLSNRNNLIARPNMIAPDGRESELFIGDAIRYVETITSGQNGPSVQIGTVRVGINLSVLPRISADGTMTLDLRPVVSFLTGFKRVSVQGFAAELPQTSERISQQTITMRSGETFAISGLIQSQDVKQLSGIPILMDLPIIGALFRRTTTQTIRRELVVFVTAKALEGPLTTENSELPMKADSEAMKPKKAKTEKN